MEVLYGLHPVEEAILARSRRFDHVCMARERSDAKLDRIAALCREHGIRLQTAGREHLTALARSPGHQGVVALVRPRARLELEDLLEPVSGRSTLLLALDGVEDPQNLGALLRSADGAGVHGVIATERRAAPLSAVAVKASAGAAEHVLLTRVVNLTRALEQIKAAGIWVLGLDERGAADYETVDYTQPCALVLGREGAGLHELVRKHCDQLLRIPMAGAVASLNVSVAGAVVLFEAARQRRSAAAAAAAAAAEPAVATPKKQKGLGSF